MSVELRSDKQNIYLIGLPSHQINGAKLPSNRQVLTVLFYNIREVKLTVSESANLVIRECIIFWEKARIPTKAFPNCVKKLVELYHVWRELQKNCKKTQVTFKNRENNFVKDLDNLFDIAHADAFDRMKIEEDKDFLRKQREADSLECLENSDEEQISNSELSTPIPCPEKSSKRGWKLLPGLDVRSSKEERLPIIASFDDREQLLAVPKLESSSGKHQAKAISTALFDWSLHDKVQIMCCDTTASNTGRFSGACAILEQTLERELLLFAFGHHIYELVLKSVFETKTELEKPFIRDDYCELVELCFVFIGGDTENKLKLRPPGALHQARWMARAIYSIKIYMTLDDFVTQRSKQFLSRLQIDGSFLREDISSWGDNPTFLEARRRISRLKIVNDTAERAGKLMQDFNELITAEELQKQFLLRCVQEHRNLINVQGRAKIKIETCIRIESGTWIGPVDGSKIDIKNRTVIVIKIDRNIG
ncbi:hypothetical protein EVAR_32992_1 [Eumeta japonica]|uniref:Uncharacterized protein n=1 Tax=Eumeta variegata TaxID=151549 RepID=A0A4C1VQ77_EUMVA|nr:hypothetical protein EVAR_32992_1 [Eumeta japonica]